MVTPEKVSPAAAAAAAEAGSVRLPEELHLTLVVVAFAVAALVFLAALSWSKSATPFVLRCYIITIIVFGTLLVVSSSYGTEQIAPVVGLFGTIAGYILGRSDNKSTAAPDAAT